eukprot:61676-Hanusia_phi.AAC.1
MLVPLFEFLLSHVAPAFNAIKTGKMNYEARMRSLFHALLSPPLSFPCPTSPRPWLPLRVQVDFSTVCTA